MNDPAGNWGTQIGNTLYYPPIPLDSTQDPWYLVHADIGLFENQNAINKCISIPNWNFRDAAALWRYDKNYNQSLDGQSFIDNLIQTVGNININDLQTALGIIENNSTILNNLTKILHYTTDNGDILLGLMETTLLRLDHSL